MFLCFVLFNCQFETECTNLDCGWKRAKECQSSSLSGYERHSFDFCYKAFHFTGQLFFVQKKDFYWRCPFLNHKLVDSVAIVTFVTRLVALMPSSLATLPWWRWLSLVAVVTFGPVPEPALHYELPRVWREPAEQKLRQTFAHLGEIKQCARADAQFLQPLVHLFPRRVARITQGTLNFSLWSQNNSSRATSDWVYFAWISQCKCSAFSRSH